MLPLELRILSSKNPQTPSELSRDCPRRPDTGRGQSSAFAGMSTKETAEILVIGFVNAPVTLAGANSLNDVVVDSGHVAFQ